MTRFTSGQHGCIRPLHEGMKVLPCNNSSAILSLQMLNLAIPLLARVSRQEVTCKQSPLWLRHTGNLKERLKLLQEELHITTLRILTVSSPFRRSEFHTLRATSLLLSGHTLHSKHRRHRIVTTARALTALVKQVTQQCGQASRCRGWSAAADVPC